MATEVLTTSPTSLAVDEESLRAIVDNTFDAIVIVDQEGRLIYLSPAVERMLGYSASEHLMQNPYELLHPDDVARTHQVFGDLVAGRVDHVRMELRARHKNGSQRVFDTITTNLLDNPSVRGLLVVARDVTEQRAAEAERAHLLESERRARTEAELALDQLLSVQSVGEQLSAAESPQAVASVIVTHSRAPLGAVGCRVAILDASGKHLTNLGDGAPGIAVQAAWRRFSLDAPVPMAEVVRTGEPIWLETYETWAERYPATIVGHTNYTVRSAATLPLLIGGRVGGAVAWLFPEDRVFSENQRLFMRVLARQCGQALDRVHLYQALAERERRLQDLVRRLLAGHEEERRRVAYELHDGLAQVAAGTHQHLQVLASRYPPESKEQRDDLTRALELARRTVREARNLIRGLRPTVLDDFGLARAIHVEVEAMVAEGWDVRFDERLGPARLPQTMEIALFRAVQEALSNVRKHAGPSRVKVSLQRTDDLVRLVIRDWGCGFSQRDNTADTDRGTHIGLEGMHERVGLLGGRCSVRSRVGRGTTIEVNVPV